MGGLFIHYLLQLVLSYEYHYFINGVKETIMHSVKGNMSGQHRRQKTQHAGNYFYDPHDLPDGFWGLRWWRVEKMSDNELMTYFSGCYSLIRFFSGNVKNRDKGARRWWVECSRRARDEMKVRGIEPKEAVDGRTSRNLPA